MDPWILVWLIVAIVTTAALIAFGIALGRHALILGRTVRRFQEEVQPVADEIARGADRASRKASALQPPARPAVRGGRRSPR
jgi:hypothetical protein